MRIEIRKNAVKQWYLTEFQTILTVDAQKPRILEESMGAFRFYRATRFIGHEKGLIARRKLCLPSTVPRG